MKVVIVASLLLSALEGSSGETLRGRLEYREVEGGAWVVVVDRVTYDLHGSIRGVAPGDTVVVKGRSRKDAVCVHQVGRVFDVDSIRKSD